MTTLTEEKVRSRPAPRVVEQPRSLANRIRFGVEHNLRSLTRRYLNLYAFFEADLALTEVQMPPGTILNPRLFAGTSQLSAVWRFLGPLGKDQTTLERRLENGDIVSIGFVEGEAVAYTWMTFKEGDVSELGLKLRLEPGEAVQYDTFVAPQWRGQGFQYPLNVPILNYAREQGYKKTLAWVHVLNTRSFKNQLRSGKRVIQKVVALRFPGLMRPWLIRLPGALCSRLTSPERVLPRLT